MNKRRFIPSVDGMETRVVLSGFTAVKARAIYHKINDVFTEYGGQYSQGDILSDLYDIAGRIPGGRGSLLKLWVVDINDNPLFTRIVRKAARKEVLKQYVDYVITNTRITFDNLSACGGLNHSSGVPTS